MGKNERKIEAKKGAHENGAKVWVGVGAILGQIQCNEVGNPVYPLYAYNNDNYGKIIM